MDVSVLQFEICPNKFKLGNVTVQYGSLILECELVYYSPRSKIWVRMPERWETDTYKQHYAYWKSKKASDEFQEIVVKQIFDKFDMSREKVILLHERKAKKKCFKTLL